MVTKEENVDREEERAQCQAYGAGMLSVGQKMRNQKMVSRHGWEMQ